MGLFGKRAAANAHVENEPRMASLPGIGSILIDRVLDCSGEMCPRPQLFTKRTVRQEMTAGEVLELIVDNPSSPELLPTIMGDIGATHLGTLRGRGEWRLYIRKDG